MTTDQTLHHRGLYVEGRFFGNSFETARSFAFALANEYMRPINVDYNAPSESPPITPLFRAEPVRA